MKVVGIDLSLTGTGLATIEDVVISASGPHAWDITSEVITSKGKQDDGLESRFNRQSTISSGVLEYTLGGSYTHELIERPDLVVIESLFNSGTFAGSLIDRAGLWWRIVGTLLVFDVPVVTATPQQGKKFLTGAGNADKGAMAMYAAKLYPQWTPSTSKNANDEADGVALASVGVGLCNSDTDWPFPNTDYRQKIIDDINTKQKLREPA